MESEIKTNREIIILFQKVCEFLTKKNIDSNELINYLIEDGYLPRSGH